MTPEQATKLREPFPPALIGHLPKAGIMLDYVGHAATTDRLLQVDPDWTWEPILGPDGAPIFQSGGLWIRLTVCGVTRPGWGDGKNVKEMIGDAIRNAAMRFGVALDLWAKEDLHADASTSASAPGKAAPAAAKEEKTAPPTDALYKQLMALADDYKKLVPGFDVLTVKLKAQEKVGKAGYQGWLVKQIAAFEQNITAKTPVEKFEIPASAKAAA